MARIVPRHDIVTGDITGPAGYTDTYPWFGTFTMGQFSTVNCGGQTAALVPYTINFNADDVSQTPDRNDPPVSITKDINVVLPNAVTTTVQAHSACCPNDHIGEYFTHTFFYQPPGVSPSNPAPSVSFNEYEVEEGEWRLLDVDGSGGLDGEDVQDMFDGESEDWYVTTTLENNTITDNNDLNRWEACQKYGDSFENPGSFRLRQGLRAKSPNCGPWIYLELEYHLLGPSVSSSSPGHVHVLKEGYSMTSTGKTWVSCPFHTSSCPY